jgi:hypothetical protein
MGNAITINLIYNSLKIKKEKKYNISSMEYFYCYHCKKNFNNKIEYNEHLQYCLHGEL